MFRAAHVTLFVIGAISCARSSNNSDLNFTSANLASFDAQYDLQLKPRALTPAPMATARSLAFDKSIYELRYFKIEYDSSSEASAQYEGDIKSMKDIGGTGIPKDKLLDQIIPITTMVDEAQKISLPEGHYAAVLCPRVFGVARQCLSDAAPLNQYKTEVQESRCGRTNGSSEKIEERCKQLLFTGKNSFIAIAYPLTVKKVEGNNRFVAGDLELSYIPAPSSKTFNLLEGENSASCDEAIKKAAEGGVVTDIIEGACAKGSGPAGSAGRGEGEQSDESASGMNPNGTSNSQGLGGNTGPGGSMGDFISNRLNPSNRGPSGMPTGFRFPPGFRMAGMPGGDCFAAGTKILGVKKSEFLGVASKLEDLSIEKIEEGDYVLNPLTQSLVPVTGRTNDTLPPGKSLYQLSRAGITVTGVHPFLVRRGLTFVGNFFTSTQNRIVANELLNMTGESLLFKAETIERKDTTAPFEVFNVKTDASRAVPVAKMRVNRSMLPPAFACTREFRHACENFLAVKTAADTYLVAGDFTKQEILGDIMRGVSSASYQGAIGNLK